MAKLSRPVLYVLVGSVAIAAWFLTSDDTPTRQPLKKTAAKTTAKADPGGFTEEDKTATFEPVNISLTNAFKPLIVRADEGSLSGMVLEPNRVPQDFASGDPNWYYTGTAEVNGVPTVLLENLTTMEGEFLKAGESWKRAKVRQITPNSVTLEGPNGRTRTLKLVDSAAAATSGTNSGFKPVEIKGPIGGQGNGVNPAPSPGRPN